MDSWFVFLPPLLIIVSVMLTQRVVLSLGAGIVLAALLYESFDLLATTERLASLAVHVVYDGGMNWGSLRILGFLLLLGMLTGLIQRMGGAEAFGQWASRRLKTKRSVHLTSVGLGLTIFPDDVFNMFTNAQIMRPLYDQAKLPREKLAYTIHSTSDPLCVLTPISSWGAYIISIFGTIIATNSLTGNPLTLFLETATFNLYALMTILVVIVSATAQRNYRFMNRLERELIVKETKTATKTTTPKTLFYPIFTLMTTALLSLYVTGRSSEESFLLTFANGDVGLSLLTGGVLAVVVASIQFRSYGSGYVSALASGVKTTLPAVWILWFAWMLSEMTGLMKTGEQAARLVTDMNLSPAWMPLALLLLTGAMAFATGTSWGTFAIMLPIAAQILLALDAETMLPVAFAAVLSGSLFGDHTSPISDTTTVASVAAGVKQMNHVFSQMPYAWTAALASAIGFFVYGLSESQGLMLMTSALVAFVTLWTQTAPVPEEMERAA